MARVVSVKRLVKYLPWSEIGRRNSSSSPLPNSEISSQLDSVNSRPAAIRSARSARCRTDGIRANFHVLRDDLRDLKTTSYGGPRTHTHFSPEWFHVVVGKMSSVRFFEKYARRPRNRYPPSAQIRTSPDWSELAAVSFVFVLRYEETTP